ncbi:MAG: FecR family protein [bacterium]
MSKKHFTVTAVVLAALFIGAAARAAEIKATFVAVSGDVQVQPAGDAEWEPAEVGAALGKGASVKTGADGSCMLKWEGGSAVKLGPLSLMKIDRLAMSKTTGKGEFELSMEKGRMTAQVGKLATKDSAFNVRTPTAIAGVRGTAFECAISPEDAQVSIAVVEGSVVLSAGGVEIILAEGFESIVLPGGIPAEPAAIPQERLNSLKSAVSGLKQAAGVSEAAEEEAEEEEADAGAVNETVVEEVTIQNQISDTYQAIQAGCPAGGGCIEGTIEF